MRKRLSILLLACGLVTAACAAPRLRVGVESGDYPISFTDAANQPAGFTAELLAEMGRAGLTEVDIVPGVWTHLIAEFRAGRIDVLANVAMTEDRRREMDFSISHAYVHGLIYSRRDRAPIRTTADFKGKTISTLVGSIAHTNAVAHHGWGATIKPFTHPDRVMAELQRGEIDGVLLIYGLEGKYFLNPHDMRREFVEDIVHHFRFAVPKGDSVNLARLNDALATVLHNGAFDRIYDRWIGLIEPHPIRLRDLRPYAPSLVLGAFAVGAIFWWQRRMLARVSRQAQALHESEERFRGLVDSAFVGWVIHQDGVIVMANSAFASSFGYAPEELVGRPMLELTAPASRTEVSAAIAAGRTSTLESIGLRKDGSPVPIETAGRACTFNGKPARIAAVRDLTAQRQAAADKLIISKLESTGILAGGIAHDFNNLLATMVLNVDMALLHPGSAAERVQYLHGIRHAAESAKALTQQLITFAQGGTSIRQPADLGALLRKTAPLALSGSNLRAEFNLAPDLWLPQIDVGQFERVVNNLVLNAREAMPGGGVITLRAENVTLAAGAGGPLPAGEYVRLDVIDRGHGIPASVLPKIFDPYFSTKQRGAQKGMGLGLTISHAIVHQHGGALTVDSIVDVGTTFHLLLPASRHAVAPLPAATPDSARRSGRILVMDDELELRTAIRFALEQIGYEVELAGDGQAAVDSFRQAQAAGRSFAAVILDLTVRGGMGGQATLSLLAAIDPAVKAIVMSGYAQEAVLRDHARHGFVGALAKPFDLESLRRSLAGIGGN